MVDINFVDTSEGRWCVRRRMAVKSHEPEALLSEDIFLDFVDNSQHMATRRQFCGEGGGRALGTISRIDRVWVSAPTAFLVPHGATAWIEERILGASC